MIDENLLETVIGLPEKLFYGTGIPAAILLFRKNKKDDKVLFIDASREYQDGKNQNQLRPQDLEKILSATVGRKNLDKYAYLASPDEIAENDYNLNIPRYVDTLEEEAEIDLMAVRAEREQLKAELAVLEERMATYLKELGYE
jgi:type I restriction enzyme M protein